MAIKYLKKGKDEADRAVDDAKVSKIVEDTLQAIAERGDKAVRDFSIKFDNYNPTSFKLSSAEIENLIKQVSKRDIEDIKFAQSQIRKFAQSQRDSMLDIEIETMPGVILGHKNIPVQSVGCYVPGGKFPMVASAHMSVVTASVAKVPRIIACTPPFKGEPNPAVIAAMHFGGAHEIYVIGGIQAVGAMSLGTETIKSVDMMVGPGNAYVAEAKRQLFGRVGIDLLAGPTETMVIADDTVDAELCATDLLGQAEHGYDSPAFLVTNNQKLAEDTLSEIDRILKILPTANTASVSWKDYGEVILCESDEEMAKISDEYAPEHLEVQTKNLDWWLKRLKNYGSLFLGEETTVAYGDKCSGTNHILPTKGAAKYTGGLFVGKFIKTLSFQRMTKESTELVGAAAARLSRYEGMEAHARTGDVRLKKYGYSK